MSTSHGNALLAGRQPVQQQSGHERIWGLSQLASGKAGGLQGNGGRGPCPGARTGRSTLR